MHSEKTDTNEKSEYEYLTQQQNEPRIIGDQSQSSTWEKEDLYVEENENLSIRINITDVSQIENEREGSKIEQTSLMERMNTDILDLDKL